MNESEIKLITVWFDKFPEEAKVGDICVFKKYEPFYLDVSGRNKPLSTGKVYEERYSVRQRVSWGWVASEDNLKDYEVEKYYGICLGGVKWMS